MRPAGRHQRCSGTLRRHGERAAVQLHYLTVIELRVSKEAKVVWVARNKNRLFCNDLAFTCSSLISILEGVAYQGLRLAAIRQADSSTRVRSGLLQDGKFRYVSVGVDQHTGPKPTTGKADGCWR